MSRRNPMLQFGRRVLCALLLLWIGVVPSLAGFIQPAEPECEMPCCKRNAAARCCKRHGHGDPADGQIKSIPACGQRCSIPLSTTATVVFADVPQQHSYSIAIAVSRLVTVSTAPPQIASPNPSLYQRPPPSLS